MDKLTFGGTHSASPGPLWLEPVSLGQPVSHQASSPSLAPGPWGEMVPGRQNKPRSQRDRDRIVTAHRSPCSLWKRML